MNLFNRGQLDPKFTNYKILVYPKSFEFEIRSESEFIKQSKIQLYSSALHDTIQKTISSNQDFIIYTYPSRYIIDLNQNIIIAFKNKILGLKMTEFSILEDILSRKDINIDSLVKELSRLLAIYWKTSHQEYKYITTNKEDTEYNNRALDKYTYKDKTIYRIPSGTKISEMQKSVRRTIILIPHLILFLICLLIIMLIY